MKIKYIIPIVFILFCMTTSCKKFLYVKPIDQLSGNNFWQDKADAEAAINGAYRLLLNKFTASTLYNDGDFRAGNWNWFNKRNFKALSENRMLSADLNYQDNTADPANSWIDFYRAIATANLCIDRIPDIDDPSLSETDKRALVAEAKFIRAFTYFWMVRLYGDVPLQFDPYDQSKKPRTDMITILDTCIHDLDKSKENLPVSYHDPTNRAVRATRGAALTLMSNMYMWKAGFDSTNRASCWQHAADLAKEVMDMKTYELLPYTDFDAVQIVFKGRSKEGIFEFSLNANYGTASHSLISQWTLHEPYLHTDPNLYGGFGSEITPRASMIDKMYPQGVPDKRFDLWFDDPYSLQNPQSAMFLKYASVEDAQTRDFDANYIFFRYAGLILLRAEALANLGQSGEAIILLNKIRERAGTPAYTGGGGTALADAIFKEREKELMGEGWLWYDLVRTKRVLDPNETSNYLTQDEFEKGAWTWPVPSAAIQDNPLIKQTIFWLNG